VFVPGGHFELGGAAVDVRPLRFGRTPVTNLEYAWFLDAGRAAEPPWWKDPLFWDPEQPVVGVTWLEAAEYCAWLCETLGGRWRLPTEAEWEHAARGGLANARTAWGATVPAGEIPESPLSGPWPVARGTANGYGLLDIGTAVEEWCQDWFAEESVRPLRRYDPRGPESGETRVSRGGSWRRPARDSKPGARCGRAPNTRAADCGFRVVREVP
jgi:formylglycine-generating enzyme required for sulfatase activity